MTNWADEDHAFRTLHDMLVERQVSSFRETTDRYDVAEGAARAFPLCAIVLAAASAVIATQAPERFLDEARAMGERALGLDSSDDVVRFFVSLVEQEAGDFDRAIELLMMNIREGGDVQDYGQAASTMSWCDRHAEAIELLEGSPFATEPVILKQIEDLRDEVRSKQRDREIDAWIRERDREEGLE
jgi:hypothetical protein